MKFCKDCKHLSSGFGDHCVSPNLGRDLITGERKSTLAMFARSYSNQCGKDAHWFEEKSKPHVPPKDTPPVVRWVKTLFSRSDS